MLLPLLLLACAPELPPGEPVLSYLVEAWPAEDPVGTATLGRTTSGWTESLSTEQGAHVASRRLLLELEDGALASLHALGEADRQSLELRLQAEGGAWTRALRMGAYTRAMPLPGRPEAVFEGLSRPGEPSVLTGPALFTWLLAGGPRTLEAAELHEDVHTPLRVERREQLSLEGVGPATRWFVHSPAQGWTVWTRDSDGVVVAQRRPGTTLRAEGLVLPERPPPQPPEGLTERPLRVPRPDTTLGGVITEPAGASPEAPLVVLIHGSGPGDRHGNYGPMQTWIFDRVAWSLAAQGLRVARYDKRGIGESAPAEGEVEQSLGALVADVAAVQDAAGGACHVLLGHSEGGIIAPARAVADPRVAGVVMMAGPASGLDQILREQLRTLYQAHGLPPERIEVLAQEQDALLRTLAQGRERDLGPLPLSAEITVAWLRSHVEHDAEGTLSQVQVPLLVLFGGEDLQVPPATQAPLARELLAERPLAQVEVMPGVDHLFMPVEGPPGMGLYDDLDRVVSPEAVRRVSEFVMNVPCVRDYTDAQLSAPEGSGGG
ncbi:MAG: alpha/beta fold hydrolase [Alphaproteobacteria bacterium]|nr:alpha/beta fold hydrolase [Alphaproteobacteria bacterium]MCB9794474.1 alpha/beta fold hydrolase [Alphaproteobacteria bacterium]